MLLVGGEGGFSQFYPQLSYSNNFLETVIILQYVKVLYANFLLSYVIFLNVFSRAEICETGAGQV